MKILPTVAPVPAPILPWAKFGFWQTSPPHNRFLIGIGKLFIVQIIQGGSGDYRHYKFHHQIPPFSKRYSITPQAASRPKRFRRLRRRRVSCLIVLPTLKGRSPLSRSRSLNRTASHCAFFTDYRRGARPLFSIRPMTYLKTIQHFLIYIQNLSAWSLDSSAVMTILCEGIVCER